MAERTYRVVLQELDASALNTTDKGTKFELLTKAFLEHTRTSL